jgi:hypothetical protein
MGGGAIPVFFIKSLSLRSNEHMQVVPDGFGVAYMTGFDGAFTILNQFSQYTHVTPTRPPAVHHHVAERTSQ